MLPYSPSLVPNRFKSHTHTHFELACFVEDVTGRFPNYPGPSPLKRRQPVLAASRPLATLSEDLMSGLFACHSRPPDSQESGQACQPHPWRSFPLASRAHFAILRRGGKTSYDGGSLLVRFEVLHFLQVYILPCRFPVHLKSQLCPCFVYSGFPPVPSVLLFILWFPLTSIVRLQHSPGFIRSRVF